MSESNKQKGKFESRREFMKTNLGKIIAGAAIVSGLHSTARGFTAHSDSEVHTNVLLGTQHIDHSNHENIERHWNQAYHTNERRHENNYADHLDDCVRTDSHWNTASHFNYSVHYNNGA